MEQVPAYGKVTVAPEVLETVARMAALAVSGVVRMAAAQPIPRALGMVDAVQVVIRENLVSIDLHIVAESSHNMLNLGRQVQAEVTRAIEDMVGLEVEAVNVYIEDVVPALEE